MQKKFTLIYLVLFLLVGYWATAQTTVLVKLTQQNGTVINGGSTTKGHAGEIVATAYGQENTGCTGNTTGGGGAGACGGKMGHFIINMQINQAYPLLNKILFLGQALKSADITFEKSGTTAYNYYTIHMENVFITHVTNQEDSGALPTVQIEMDAARTQWTFTPQNADGTPGTPVVFGWDAVKNTSF